MSKSKKPEQLYIAGTEPPKDDELERMLHLWQDASAEAKTASERKKIRHATVVARLTDKGYKAYPYFDEDGKRRILYPSTEVKAKTKAAPTAKQKDRDELYKPDDAIVAMPTQPTEVSDPFGSTRRGLLDVAAIKQDAAR